MNTKKPTLAIALIVKNEGAILGACLDSVKDLADEIVILDAIEIIPCSVKAVQSITSTKEWRI